MWGGGRSWRRGIVCWGLVGEWGFWLGGVGKGGFYERKVDLPVEGSPRRRMVTVGGMAMTGGGFVTSPTFCTGMT